MTFPSQKGKRTRRGQHLFSQQISTYTMSRTTTSIIAVIVVSKFSSLPKDPVIAVLNTAQGTRPKQTEGSDAMMCFVRTKVHSGICLVVFVVFIARILHPSRDFKTSCTNIRKQKETPLKLLTKLCWCLNFAHLRKHL